MHRSLLLPWAAAATLALAGPAAAAPASLAAAALVDSVASHYARLAAYHFAGQVHIAFHGDSMPQPFAADVPFCYAVRSPARLHAELVSTQVSSLMVSDGDTLWVAMQTLGQYLAQPAPRFGAGEPLPPAVAQALQPIREFAALRSAGTTVTELGRDTVDTDLGAQPCRRLVLDLPAGDTGPSDLARHLVLWVDEARRVVLRESLFVAFDRPDQGHVVSTQSVRFAHADDAGGGPDGLYRFRPDSGWQRVDRFGPPPPQQSQLVGKPAKPFTLAGMDGARVSLAAQRGSVVVLDFWATWCNPCRRWMPVVARLEHQLKGSGVRFWAVNVGEPRDRVRSFLATTKDVVPVLLDPDSRVATDYGASQIPLTVVIGRDGKVVQVLLGLHPETDLRAALKAAGVQGV